MNKSHCNLKGLIVADVAPSSDGQLFSEPAGISESETTVAHYTLVQLYNKPTVLASMHRICIV